MTGESGLEWAGSVSTGGERTPGLPDHFGGNFSIPEFKTWGSQSVVASVSILFTVWIVLANAFLISIVLTSRLIRRQITTLYVLQIALSDLAVGVFYCPLAASFYTRGVWTHGCLSLFTWNTFLYCTTFISVHSLGLINAVRLAGKCCRARLGPKMKLAVSLMLILLMWTYLLMVGQSLRNMEAEAVVRIPPGILCHAYLSDLGKIIASLMVFFAPGIISVAVFAVLVWRERQSPLPREQPNQPESRVFGMRTLGAANLLTATLYLPFFLVNVSLGSCVSYQCMSWVISLTTVFEWLLFAKSGIQPVVWLLHQDYRTAILPVVRFIRRQPGTDSTELVEAEDNSGEVNPRIPELENPVV